MSYSCVHAKYGVKEPPSNCQLMIRLDGYINTNAQQVWRGGCCMLPQNSFQNYRCAEITWGNFWAQTTTRLTRTYLLHGVVQKVSMQLWEFARNCYQGISRGRPIHQMELVDRPIAMAVYFWASHTPSILIHGYIQQHNRWTNKIMVWHYFYFDTSVLDFNLYNAVGQWSMANDNKGKATATKLSMHIRLGGGHVIQIKFSIPVKHSSP